jgi:hypothetical protein
MDLVFPQDIVPRTENLSGQRFEKSDSGIWLWLCSAVRQKYELARATPGPVFGFSVSHCTVSVTGTMPILSPLGVLRYIADM